MPISFTDHFNVDKEAFEATGAFDAILDVDSKLFIDPHLLQFSEVAEVRESHVLVDQHFAEILKLLIASAAKDDICWRGARERLTFREFPGTCLGYAKSGTRGSGIGPGLRDDLLSTAKEIIDVGIKDPTLFELLGLFTDDIGPDRISDMVVGIIGPKLIAFTERVSKDLGVPLTQTTVNGVPGVLPMNPSNGKPILLVPRDILRDLPMATEGFDFDTSVAASVRRELNRRIGQTWSEATKQQKKEIVLAVPTLLLAMIEAYKNAEPDPYDFTNDPAGEVRWYEATRKLSEQAPLALTLSPGASTAEVETVVLNICEQFKRLIEDNGLWELLWDKMRRPKHERAAQRLFFGVAASYCQANNLDISPESNAGQGPVDFKFSSGARAKVLVEVKLSHNKKLLAGYASQLPTYGRAENADRLIYLVIDQKAAAALPKFRAFQVNAKPPKPRVLYVDSTPKKSASRLA